jgi:hypothetical protein
MGGMKNACLRIPPLQNPGMIRAEQLAWMADGDVVFARRALDRVYCTLRRAMSLFDTGVNGAQHELGTSGCPYRSKAR